MPLTANAEQMTRRAVDEDSQAPLLTLGRVDRVRVQVGYRASPEDPAYDQFLLDVAVPEADGGGAAGHPIDERRILAALEPVLYVDAEAPRHYSLNQHRWHTSWGPSPAAMEIGLLVTTEMHDPAANSWRVGLRTAAGESYDVVVGFLDGYAGSVRVRHQERMEARDSLGPV